MNISDYQTKAARTTSTTVGFDPTEDQTILVWNALGLAGEAGEVADTVKKAVFHQHGLDLEKLKIELGDVLWYIAAICTQLDVKLEDVMQANIDKLHARYPEGFSVEKSKNRAE